MTMKSIHRILPMSVLERLEVPIVLAPLAGGPSTPELAAAVCNGGGLGFLAGGYLTAGALAERIGALRELTGRPFGVNLFVPSKPADPSAYAGYTRGLGEPRFDDDDWSAKVALMERERPDVVSFTFGCPSSAELARMGEAWVTVTSPEEAATALSAGAGGLVVQGSEAGGHPGGVAGAPRVAQNAPPPLLQPIRTRKPLIANRGGPARPPGPGGG